MPNDYDNKIYIILNFVLTIRPINFLELSKKLSIYIVYIYIYIYLLIYDVIN